MEKLLDFSSSLNKATEAHAPSPLARGRSGEGVALIGKENRYFSTVVQAAFSPPSVTPDSRFI
jgi:hypothetical protein